jgi:hypothetical protein
MMAHIRTYVMLVALGVAATPLAAQVADGGSRYDAGSFVIELPPGIRLARIHAAEFPTMRSESFVGGDLEHGAVMITHAVMTELPSDPAFRTPAGTRQALSDTARRRAAIQSAPDTSRALRNEFMQTLNDTSLATRRALLESTRAPLAQNASRVVVLGTQTREIVTENRVTLRSSATLHIDNDLSLVGTADASMPCRGAGEFWIVIYATKTRTPESDAIAARMLDTFRLTGGPTTVETTPPGGGAP